MIVRECLHKAPVTVPPKCTLEEAAQLMRSHDVGALLVLDGNRLEGVVTDRDLALRGMGAGRPATSEVGELMTGSPVTIQGSADIFEAYRILKSAGVRRLPVLEDEELAGIITVDDLLVSLVLELAAVISPIAGEVVRPAPAG